METNIIGKLVTSYPLSCVHEGKPPRKLIWERGPSHVLHPMRCWKCYAEHWFSVEHLCAVRQRKSEFVPVSAFAVIRGLNNT